MSIGSAKRSGVGNWTNSVIRRIDKLKKEV
jgi:hypothetical protein